MGFSYTSKLISLNYTVDDIIKVSDKLILKLNGTSNNIDCYTINSNYELISVSGYPVSISSFNSGYLIQSDKLYLYHYNQTIYTEPALPNIPVTASDYYYYIKTK